MKTQNNQILIVRKFLKFDVLFIIVINIKAFR